MSNRSREPGADPRKWTRPASAVSDEAGGGRSPSRAELYEEWLRRHRGLTPLDITDERRQSDQGEMAEDPSIVNNGARRVNEVPLRDKKQLYRGKRWETELEEQSKRPVARGAGEASSNPDSTSTTGGGAAFSRREEFYYDQIRDDSDEY